MQRLEMRLDDITGEQISDLVRFLDSGELPEWMTKAKMAMLYGRLKARGEKIEKAELRLKPDYDKKKESYKWRIINEIKQWVEEMRNETWWVGHYQYEIVNIKSRVDGRTMQIWFQDTDVNDKIKWRKSILIEEKENPEFFQEMLQKYAPNLQPKPF